jgi:hypothetical protein
MNEAEFIITTLQLKPHPEGGFFSEIYRSQESIDSQALPDRYNGNRNFSTSIYFLLNKEQVSLFHRISSDEIWHFYSGSPVIIHCLDKVGYRLFKLGNDLHQAQDPQLVIKAGTWFAAEVENKNSYSLVGCTVAPGFDFKDFIFGKRDELLKLYPQHQELILNLTKE